MDSLRASYMDDDNAVSGEPQSPPHSSTAVDGGASATPPLDKEDATASDDFSSDGISDEISKPQINRPSSPNFTKPSDTEDDEDYEEPQPKKQRQISSLSSPSLSPSPSDLNGVTAAPSPSTPATVAGEGPSTSSAAKTASKSSKKSKKRNTNVWARPTSRKGKKKAKNNGGSNNGAQANNEGELEEKVMITPTPRFPDKNDDSQDAKICLSKVYKAEKVELSEDRMSAGSTKGYRMVRATRGVVEGAWYFEIKVVHLGDSGHTRLGWTTDKGDLQAPVGYDGNSFGYRDIDGSKVHKAVREKYGEEGYKEGDVIGFYINLPQGSLYTPKAPRWVWYKGQKYVSAPEAKDDPPKVVSGSEICFFKNGICQGTAFSDLFGGRYFPAASLYTLPNQPNCTVKFNFGPDFEFFPDDFGGRVVPRPMIEVPFHGLDVRVENGGSSWHPTRMCPMLLNVTKFVDADA